MKADLIPRRNRALLNASDRWFRLLLWFYPPDFRDEMGAALTETYRERTREASRRGGIVSLAVLWTGALLDSVRNGLGERLRPAASWRRAGDWGRDLERVSRRFTRKPMFVIVMVGTLTVGLGIFAVVYTAVDKILLEPLPYANSEDLYLVSHEGGGQITGPEVADLQKAGGLIEGAVAMRTNPATIPAGEKTDAIRLRVIFTSWNLFEVLGARPALGRGFRPDEDAPGSPLVVVLSDALWKRLGGDAAIVGSRIPIGSNPFTVVGVMPAEFKFSGIWSNPPDLYMPLYVNFAAEPPDNHNYTAFIRARHGASPEDVRQAVDAVGRFADRRDNAGKGRTLLSTGFKEEIVEEVRPALLALGVAVVFMVLVLTVNLASLLLARAAEREREFAVSRALGASGPAVVRATIIEGALLGLMGGIAGAWAGAWGTRLLVALGPDDLPRRDALALDWGAAGVVIAVGIVLGLVAAAVPAIWAARASLPSLLAASAVRGGASSGRMRRSLIVAQVALSLVLLSTGGLVVRSFLVLLTANPGFRPEGVLTFSLGLGDWLFEKDVDSYAFQDRVEAAILALPGVIGVSATTALPITSDGNITGVRFPGAPGNTGDPERDNVLVTRLFTRAGYIGTMGMRLLAGRDFDVNQTAGVREAIIDRHLAERFFPTGSPIGATVRHSGNSVTIVGVVEQARLYSLHEDDDRPQFFVRGEDYEGAGFRPSWVVVRASRDPLTLMPEIRSAIRQVDRRPPVSHVRTMDEIVADRRSRERISAVLISGLALGALVLVSMGLFGVISGSVTRRRGELAVRLAMGATHGRVVRFVVGEGARLIALGLLIGLPGVYVTGQALKGFLIAVSPFDTPTLVVIAIALVSVTLFACYLGARKVTGIQPARLLNEE